MHDQVEKIPGTTALAKFCEVDDTAKEFTKELRSILEVTAATGRYWHEWSQLRLLLCFRLTQVLEDFHQLNGADDEGPIIGPPAPGTEAFPDMVGRLVECLESFTDGAPFTNQRLCEVLLCPKETYNNLDKLALALEKLLMVQSTYPPSSDPYPELPLAVATTEEERKSFKEEANGTNGVQDHSTRNGNDTSRVDVEMADVEHALDDTAVDSNSNVRAGDDVVTQNSVEASKMLQDAGDQDANDNAVVSHGSSAGETTKTQDAASEMLIETTGSCTVEVAMNVEVHRHSATNGLQNQSGNFALVNDASVVNSTRTDATISVARPSPQGEAVVSSTGMLHVPNAAQLSAAPAESIDSIDMKSPRAEQGASNQFYSSGVHSPQASQGSVDVKHAAPEESVNSHVPNIEEDDRLEDVSMLGGS